MVAGSAGSSTPPSPFSFSLGVLDTVNTPPIDWTTLAPDLQPSFINNAAWAAIVPNLTAQLGSTWGQYVQQLDNDSIYLAGINEPTTDASQLLSFEIEKANADFGAPAVAITVVDLPAPGMDLTFALSFQQSISGRYTPSIVGLGWTTNWDLSASTQPNGDVAIHVDGPELYFSLQPDGTYKLEDSDQGTTLTKAAAPTSSSIPAATLRSSTPTALWITSRTRTATPSRLATTPRTSSSP